MKTWHWVLIISIIAIAGGYFCFKDKLKLPFGDKTEKLPGTQDV